jgi:hypothetical protein
MPTGLPQPGAAETTLHQYDANRWYPRHAEIIDRLEQIKASSDGVVAAIQAAQTAIVQAVQAVDASVQANTTAVQAVDASVQAVQTEITTLQGIDSRDLTDIWNQIAVHAADLAQVEASLTEVVQTLRGISPGKEASDTRNVIDVLIASRDDTVIPVREIGAAVLMALGLAEAGTYQEIETLFPTIGIELTSTLVRDPSTNNEMTTRKTGYDTPSPIARLGEIAERIGILQGNALVDPSDEDYLNRDQLGASYSPTIEGILTKLTAMQGPPVSGREAVIPYRLNMYRMAKLSGLVEVINGEDPTNWWQLFLDVLGGTSDLVDLADDLAEMMVRIFGTGADAVTAGSTSATAVGQWITALSLAVIAYQNNADLVKQIQMRNDIQEILQAVRGSNAPNDNILQAIRGDTDASATRNVIDAVSGLTLTADNITIDVTTLETRLDSLIDQVERLRGVTPDAAAANVDDVFQELNDLRGDVTTLMSTADSSSFMQIVDIVEAVSGAQKEVANFRKDFAVTDFCCDTTIITLPPEPDDTAITLSDYCQRVQWYIDAGFDFLMELSDFNAISINAATIESLYQKHFDIAPHEYDRDTILWNYRAKAAAGGTYFSDVLAQYSFIQSASVDLDVDGNSIASVPGLLCSFYNQAGATAAKAKSLFDQLLDAYYGPRSGGVIPSVNESSRLIIESTLSSTSLIALLQDMTIPADPADLTGYDNTACAVCSGLGDCPLAPGESVDIPSGGSFSISGYQREAIVWPTSGSWANIPRNDGIYGVPGGNIQTDCVAGWEVSFPFDQLSNDTFRFTYKPDGLTAAQVDIQGGSTWTVPANTVELMVFRSGSGTPWDRPFTLRVTRPL